MAKKKKAELKVPESRVDEFGRTVRTMVLTAARMRSYDVVTELLKRIQLVYIYAREASFDDSALGTEMTHDVRDKIDNFTSQFLSEYQAVMQLDNAEFVKAIKILKENYSHVLAEILVDDVLNPQALATSVAESLKLRKKG